MKDQRRGVKLEQEFGLLLTALLGGLESNPLDPLSDEDRFFCEQCRIPLSQEPQGLIMHCRECRQMLCSICVRPQECPDPLPASDEAPTEGKSRLGTLTEIVRES